MERPSDDEALLLRRSLRDSLKLSSAPGPSFVTMSDGGAGAGDVAERRSRLLALLRTLDEADHASALARGECVGRWRADGEGPDGDGDDDDTRPSAVPSNGEELTVRALLVGSLVGGFLSLMNIYMGFKLAIWLPVGLPATIIGFAVMRGAVARLGCALPVTFGAPFGVRENVVLQTAAVAAAEMASASGICSTIFAATCEYQRFRFAKSGGAVGDDDNAAPVQNASAPFGMCPTDDGEYELRADGGAAAVAPASCECLAGFGAPQVIIYCYAVVALGIFYSVPLRTVLLDRMDLPWPTPTATAVVICSMHATRAKRKRALSNQSTSNCQLVPAGSSHLTSAK